MDKLSVSMTHCSTQKDHDNNQRPIPALHHMPTAMRGRVAGQINARGEP